MITSNSDTFGIFWIKNPQNVIDDHTGCPVA